MSIVMVMCVAVFACPRPEGTPEEQKTDAEGMLASAVVEFDDAIEIQTEALALHVNSLEVKEEAGDKYVVYQSSVCDNNRHDEEEVDEAMEEGDCLMADGTIWWNLGNLEMTAANVDGASGLANFANEDYCEAYDDYLLAEEHYEEAAGEFWCAKSNWDNAEDAYEEAMTLMCIDCDVPAICGEGEA